MINKSKSMEIYENIVDQFKEELKKSSNPFIALGKPKNGLTNRGYKGFNKLYLGLVTGTHNYSNAVFVTYNQAKEAGGKVIPGEKGYPIFFWSSFYLFKGKISVVANSKNEALIAAKKKRASITMGDFIKQNFFLKYFTVFNIEQVEGGDFASDDSSDSTPISKLLEATHSQVVDGAMPMYISDTDTLEYPLVSSKADSLFKFCIYNLKSESALLETKLILTIFRLLS